MPLLRGIWRKGCLAYGAPALGQMINLKYWRLEFGLVKGQKSLQCKGMGLLSPACGQETQSMDLYRHASSCNLITLAGKVLLKLFGDRDRTTSRSG